jgi:flagellar basal-body rod protein FlgG
MQDSVYNGVFGAMTQMYRMDTIANNLANVQTAGYKREESAFHDVMQHRVDDFVHPGPSLERPDMLPEPDLLTQPRISGSHIVFEQGPLQKTGNPLDLAIQGEGFFRVRTPEGEAYTRTGQFKVRADGTVVTGNGHELLSQGGPLQLPGTGTVSVNQGGLVSQNGQAVGRIDLVTFDDVQALRRQGGNLFRLAEDSQARQLPAEGATIAQGCVEKSNVNVVEEMVRMIETNRIFEACQKVVSSTNEEDGQLIRKLGNPV